MFSLSFYSLFFREIKIGKWKKMPENLANLSEKIMKNEPVTGQVFRPTPQMSIFMTILMGLICWGFMYVIFFVFYTDFIGSVLKGTITALGMLLLFILLFIYFFYYTFLSYLIFPKWLKNRLNSYFIYIGPEGIIRKDYFRACFIPWSIVNGAIMNHTYVAEEGGNLELDLYIKDHKVWTPMLINSYAFGSLFYGLVTYNVADMRSIENSINNYAKEIGYKIN